MKPIWSSIIHPTEEEFSLRFHCPKDERAPPVPLVLRSTCPRLQSATQIRLKRLPQLTLAEDSLQEGPTQRGRVPRVLRMCHYCKNETPHQDSWTEFIRESVTRVEDVMIQKHSSQGFDDRLDNPLMTVRWTSHRCHLLAQCSLVSNAACTNPKKPFNTRKQTATQAEVKLFIYSINKYRRVFTVIILGQ